MSNGKWLTYAARTIHIAGLMFISLFALDVAEGQPLAEIVLGLIIHLIPSLVLLAFLAIAWFQPAAGGVLLLIAGGSVFFALSNPILVNLMLGGPFILAGLLYLGGWWLNRVNAQP